MNLYYLNQEELFKSICCPLQIYWMINLLLISIAFLFLLLLLLTYALRLSLDCFITNLCIIILKIHYCRSKVINCWLCCRVDCVHNLNTAFCSLWEVAIWLLFHIWYNFHSESLLILSKVDVISFQWEANANLGSLVLFTNKYEAFLVLDIFDQFYQSKIWVIETYNSTHSKLFTIVLNFHLLKYWTFLHNLLIN